MVRWAESRTHPHERWLSGHREDGKKIRKYVIADRLGISSGHLSSIYGGSFAPSDELAAKMAALTAGACSKREILEWHRKNPPVWKRDQAIKKAISERGTKAARRKRSRREVSAEPPSTGEKPTLQ